MKEKIKTIISILLWVAIVVLTVFRYFAREPNDKLLSRYENLDNKSILQVSEYLYVEEGCSDEQVEQIQYLVGYVPKPLFKAFTGENGRIILVSDLKGNCIGSTEIRTDGIIIYIKDGYVWDALMHEFGHVYLQFYPMKEDFIEIYKAEGKSLVNSYYGNSPYNYSNEVEYFAQAFQTVVCMKGYDTKEAAPMTFSYINNLIKDLLEEK